MAKDGGSRSILSDFLGWVREHGGRHMLYRGIAGKERPASAAIARRLRNDEKNEGEFIRANRELIEIARMRGHDTRKNLQRDLDILAELQHYGAATCLMDFTRNPFAGLWFACKNRDHKNGRVFAIDSGDYDRFVKINTNSMKESIGDLLPSRRRKGKLWVWEPKRQNERIIAQQSVFVFGAAEIQPEHVFLVKNTEGILNELQKYGVSLESLFCDFDGFARANESAQQYGAENYLDKATDEHAQEKYEDAIGYYDCALKNVKEKSIHYYHRGRAKASLGATADKAEADAYYKQAIEDYNKSPDSEKMLFHRGNAKGQSGDLPGAIADYGRAIDINSLYAEAYSRRGNAKGKLGDHKGTIADCNSAIKINRQDAVAYHDRGVAKYHLGDLSGAIADNDQAIKINRKYASAYYNRGSSKHALGDLSGAIADYDQAIELAQYAEAYNSRGGAKYHFGDLSGAIADFDRAIELEPQFALAYHNRAVAKREQGDMKGSAADFQRVWEIAPSLKPPEDSSTPPQKK